MSKIASTETTPQGITYIERLNSKTGKLSSDAVSVEEPLELRLVYHLDGKQVEQSISITMRSPGADDELALGFLLTEGIIENFDAIKTISHCGPTSSTGVQNIVKVELQADISVNVGSLLRNFYTTSSCGVCGKSSLEALRTESRYSIDNESYFLASTLYDAPTKLRQNQPQFSHTGGNHAVGLMNSHGELLAVREDVGRHNALDKIIGYASKHKLLPLSSSAIILSGRASFELLQKSVMAGCPLVAAVGAPSSLAIECAKEYDVTLLGFLHADHFNIYHHPERIKF